MERAASSSSRHTIRTDLSLLIECLKFQMKCPDLQKQALLTILSICENRGDNVELLREMGGVAFLLNLSKSSIVQSDVKETALFTLGTLAEANVYCKNSLCRKDIFTDLADWLLIEDTPLTKKRVMVYFLSVLVANNRSGQTLAQTSGCLDILLNLFRTAFPLFAKGIFKKANPTHLHQLWSSVSSALCGCVNNPQNEEGQRICVAVFPTVKTWFQQISLPQTDIFQPICSFIAMVVANNSCVQESFAASEGLENLTLALIRFCLGSETSLLACQLAVSMSKTLSACISDNPSIASDLSKYGVVCHLFSLLINPKLEAEDRLSVLLTMGHCTESSGYKQSFDTLTAKHILQSDRLLNGDSNNASLGAFGDCAKALHGLPQSLIEEHQKQLLQIGSLPVIITLLTEDSSEEVRKAATFILQTCKQATNDIGSPDKEERHGKAVTKDLSTCKYNTSAKDLLQRIDQLEKIQAEAEKELACSQITGPLETEPANVSGLTQEEDCESDDEPLIIRVNRNLNSNKIKSVSCPEDQGEASGGGVWWSAYSNRDVRCDTNVQMLEGAREPHENNSQPFQVPGTVWQNAPKDEYPIDEELRNETNDPGEEQSISEIRCTGCVLRFDEVNSCTFWSLQSSCAHSCDMHKVLQEATERYISHHHHHRSLLAEREHPLSTSQLTNPSFHKNQKDRRDICLTPINKQRQVKRIQSPCHWQEDKDIRLTPLHKGMKIGPAYCRRTGPTPSERPPPPESLPKYNEQADEKTEVTDPCSSSARRRRQDFSHEEELYLLCGVKTYGPSWNAILWSYPFQPGRTNVDLAKKYRRLMKNKAQA